MRTSLALLVVGTVVGCTSKPAPAPAPAQAPAEQPARQFPAPAAPSAEQGGDTREGGEYLGFAGRDAINAAEGTIEIEVVRNEQQGELETLFAILDAAGETLMKAEIWWERGEKGGPVAIANPSNPASASNVTRTLAAMLFGLSRP